VVTPKGKVVTLNRGAGETHVEALTRLTKSRGDAFLHPLENGWIRQSGDMIHLHDLSNPNLLAAFNQAEQTAEFAKSNGVVIIHAGGPPIEIRPEGKAEFFRNPQRWVRKPKF
jgi:hypothetical protein